MSVGPRAARARVGPVHLAGVVVTLAMSACGQRERPPLPPPRADAPAAAPAPSAPAASSAPAESPPGPPRPALTTERGRFIESVLRDTCAVTYTPLEAGGHALGCASCDLEAGAPGGSFVVTEPGAVAPWMVLSAYKGSFSRAGIDEVFMTLGGSCNPKHPGWALLQRQGGRYAVVDQSPARHLGTCHLLARSDGRHMLACFDSLETVFASHELGTVLRFGDDAEEPLFTLTHWSAGVGLLTGLRWVADASIKGTEAVDADHDGLVDAVVTVALVRTRHRDGRPVSPARRTTERWVFVNTGTSLRPDAATARALEALKGELPPEG